jgi:hypothetical protein
VTGKTSAFNLSVVTCRLFLRAADDQRRGILRVERSQKTFFYGVCNLRRQALAPFDCTAGSPRCPLTTAEIIGAVTDGELNVNNTRPDWLDFINDEPPVYDVSGCPINL